MRTAIVGAGAMGSLFGAMLAEVSELCLIDPYEEHVKKICRDGLTVEKPDGSAKTYRLTATTDSAHVKPGVDLAIIFTKSRRTAEAARTAKPLLAENGLILTLQNGIGNAEIIADIVGEKQTLAGVTSHGGTLLGPGRVRHAGMGPTYISTFSPRTLSPEPVIRMFEKAGIDVHVSDDLQTLVWGKLIINVGINALAAILRVPNGVLGLKSECEKIMSAAVSEAVAVANALHIRLPYENPMAVVKSVCEKTGANRASMLQDILRGADTEVNVINMAIVRKGEELGISTPYNRFLSEIIEALEATAAERLR